MNAITLQNLGICYERAAVLENLTHSFAAGQWHIILGRSGAGKTTLLHAIAGLLPANASITGNIKFQNQQSSITNQPDAGSAGKADSSFRGTAQDAKTTAAGSKPIPQTNHQQIALMQQKNDILPWLSVLDNVTLAERLHSCPPDRGQALELLRACGIAELANAKPQTLSGGQLQRVSLARTLMQQQPIVLMDEPFSALDAITRRQLQDLATRLLHRKTVLMITHDPAEALRLADTLHILTRTGLTAVPLPADAPPRPADARGIAQAEEQLISLLSAGGHV